MITRTGNETWATVSCKIQILSAYSILMICINDFSAVFSYVCQNQVELGIETDGSNLSGVSGHCLWQESSASQPRPLYDKEDTELVDKNELGGDVELRHGHLSSRGSC
jgi:hypothetical protein